MVTTTPYNKASCLVIREVTSLSYQGYDESPFDTKVPLTTVAAYKIRQVCIEGIRSEQSSSADPYHGQQDMGHPP